MFKLVSELCESKVRLLSDCRPPPPRVPQAFGFTRWKPKSCCVRTGRIDIAAHLRPASDTHKQFVDEGQEVVSGNLRRGTDRLRKPDGLRANQALVPDLEHEDGDRAGGPHQGANAAQIGRAHV